MTASKTPFLFPTDTIAYVALILSWIRIEAFDTLQSPCELPAAFGSSFGDFAPREFCSVFNSVNNPKFSGLLLRVPAGAAAAFSGVAEKSLRAAGVAFELKPLFKTSAVGRTANRIGVTSGDDWEWHIARPKVSVDGASPWELAHAAVANRLGLSAETEMFVEPDLEQEWIYENPIARDAMAAAADACVFNDQIGKLPGLPGHFAWHLSSDFSQLKTARDAVGDNPNGQAIRIAHLDTGYYADHKAFPKNVRLDLQRNFMDDQADNDAHDPSARGVLKNPGHGIGTLSILAGNRFSFSGPGYTPFNDYIGGAPAAEIVPVRVGKSVVQILTSSIAAGISYVADLCTKEASRVHAISMSMGGVASQAWADAVNKAYEAGILYVAAAGNNFSSGLFGVPTRLIVYPARFRRVIAACGIMENLRPYYGLPFGTMQGNWGPDSKMATAMAAFTPNMPWAELGCAGIVDMDGQGTSAATPQIAAAAALYLQKHARKIFDLANYPEPWMRVEAVRHALFISANKLADGGSAKKLGNGVLQAARALASAPPNKRVLQKMPQDSAAFPFLHAFTGLGVAQPTAADRMLALEATQLSQQWPRTDVPNPFDAAVPDPDIPSEAISVGQRRAYLEALLEHPRASQQLRQRVKEVLGKMPPPSAPSKRLRVKASPPPKPKVPKAVAPAPRAPFIPTKPPFRRLRGFALDPSLSTELETAPISQITFKVPWETLTPGPVGEYLEIIDFDPGSDCFYEPVNLDKPVLLAQDGLAPSEGTPQFHQQMVYAVASLTIQNFESALGRRILWRPGPATDPSNPKDDSVFIQRLRIYPHGLRERNAYYSPQKIALLFGYFKASDDTPGDHMPGEMVFSCLSHDIVAHETTHALLDGMNRCFLSPTNPDVHAFHEAFADLVALFQHFTFPEILRHQITATRGDIQSQENLLGQLASQFGRGIGLRAALRDAIGKMEDGKWVPHKPDPQEYENTAEPHARGAILVAAVFDAFLSIYKRRTADLLRLATGGTGVLRPGAIHPDLVNRLAQEAAKSAHHALTMCVRAIDYCPPVDITFGEFLRAVITADFDLVEDDDLNYRIAFIEAFRKRGIYSRDVRTLSVESLLWRGPDNDEVRPSSHLENTLAQLRSFADTNLYTESRRKAFHFEREFRRSIHQLLSGHFVNGSHGDTDAAYLGLEPNGPFEVRSARIAYRTRPDSGLVPQFVVTLLQRSEVPMDPNDPNGQKMSFDGGCTLVADLRDSRIQYCIRKNASSDARLLRQQGFATQLAATSSSYFGTLREGLVEPFAAIHRGM